jgi:proteasome lid subunit RPN8/RPN11
VSTLEITPEQSQRLDELASSSYPEECCGVLLGRAGWVTSIWPTPNVHPGPRSRRFAIDPRELLKVHKVARDEGVDVIGYYHSHPDGAARPSNADLAAAVPAVSYLILAVTSDGVTGRRCWRLCDDANGYVEEQIV